MENQQARTVCAHARQGRAEAGGSAQGETSCRADAPQLLATYGPRLYGFFLRSTGSHHEAEDLLSELMLRVVRHIDAYDERGKLEPWLFRIAANLLRDRIRRRQSTPQSVSLEVESPSGGSLSESLSGDAPMPEDSLRSVELSARVQKALDKLDDSSRQMVLLRHFAEMSFKEIAELFSCPIGTVLAKVHRALKALREILEADHELE